MEILSAEACPDTVSHVHVRPAPDTLTTFQNARNIRVLIGGNTKHIILIWEQRDSFRSFPHISCFTDLHVSVHKCKSRSTAGSSGQTRHLDLVVSGPGPRILFSSVFPFSVLLRFQLVPLFFRCFRSLPDRPDWTRILARVS